MHLSKYNICVTCYYNLCEVFMTRSRASYKKEHYAIKLSDLNNFHGVHRDGCDVIPQSQFIHPKDRCLPPPLPISASNL